MIDIVELTSTPPARISKARCSCCETILHHNARTRAYYRTVGDAVAGRRALIGGRTSSVTGDTIPTEFERTSCPNTSVPVASIS